MVFNEGLKDIVNLFLLGSWQLSSCLKETLTASSRPADSLHFTRTTEQEIYTRIQGVGDGRQLVDFERSRFALKVCNALLSHAQ